MIMKNLEKHFPVRGRKPAHFSPMHSANHDLEKHFPVRGRKRTLCGFYRLSVYEFRKTFPRKGTETRDHLRSAMQSSI